MSERRKEGLKRKFADAAKSKLKASTTIYRINHLRNCATSEIVRCYEAIGRDRIVFSFMWRLIEMKTEEIVGLLEDRRQLEYVWVPMLRRPTAPGVAAANRDIDFLYEKYDRRLRLRAKRD